MDRPKFSDLRGVKWLLAAQNHVRVLNKNDLSALGLGDLGVDELRWDASNEWVVPTTLLDAHAVDVLISFPEFEAV